MEQVILKPCSIGTGALVLDFESDSLIARDAHKFSAIIKLLNNFEVYPVSKDRLRFSGVIENCYHVSLLDEDRY